jgi:hypothetical protein
MLRSPHQQRKTVTIPIGQKRLYLMTSTSEAHMKSRVWDHRQPLCLTLSHRPGMQLQRLQRTTNRYNGKIQTKPTTSCGTDTPTAFHTRYSHPACITQGCACSQGRKKLREWASTNKDSAAYQ